MCFDTSPVSLIERQFPMRLVTTKAKTIKPGDQVVAKVSRVLGAQGRKPANGDPLVKIEFEDGTQYMVRSSEKVHVIK